MDSVFYFNVNMQQMVSSQSMKYITALKQLHNNHSKFASALFFKQKTFVSALKFSFSIQLFLSV